MIVVLGVGRSGTTFVAETLASMGVEMGADAMTCYEDPALRLELARLLGQKDGEGACRRLLAARLGRMCPDPWDAPCGMKEPRLLDFGTAIADAARDAGVSPAWVYCRRDPGQVLASWLRVTTSREKEARARIAARERALEAVREMNCGAPFVEIDFSERRTRSYVEARLRRLLVADEARFG